MKRAILLACVAAGIFFGCTSTNDSFLLQKLDDQSKSRALTEAGVEQYEIHVVRQAEYDRIAEVRSYFVVALQYDPANARAQQYLALVDDARNMQLKKNLTAATRALQKQKRTDDENFAIFVSLQTVVKIDPDNARARKMLADTASLRSALVTSYLARATAAIDAARGATSDSVKEKQYAEAFRLAGRALAIEPGNAGAQNRRDTARADLARLVTDSVGAAQTLIASGSFPEARAQLGVLSELSRRAGGIFDAEVSRVAYALNYAWAVSLYNRKDYTTADVKIEAALTAKKTDEARALRRKIADRKAQAAVLVSFDASIQEIDNLIAAGELVAAHRKVNSLASITKDPASMRQLDSRNDRIISTLGDLYDKGVRAYREEDFRTAIDVLQQVVAIQVDYEQASDYLDRALSKQTLLDQY